MVRVRDGRVLSDTDLSDQAEVLVLVNAEINLLASLDVEGLVA